MGELTRRVVWVTGLGAVLGLGWWLLYLALTPSCDPSFLGCEIAVVLLAPVWAMVSWLAAWFVLDQRQIDRPGVTAAAGVVVALVLGVITALRDIPFSPWAVLLGAVSFLLAALLAA
ncbi:hypothetical protein F4560_007143 [Saccharothrix ecbatanensis]|uniref:Uncharacterized protein n=1 Tax=Saccharothrix ecbatanensis TaxID=1105145 RepID=A0A7W9HRY4_9PSEU|nr:hypothetical protein [Saccharothrix ecbatanensis]MBB5807375.1 hypothetical protein [Saccharothrix ecbatanensis]